MGNEGIFRKDKGTDRGGILNYRKISLFFEDSETLYNMGFEIWFVFFLFPTILSYQTVDKSNSIE